jgi:hypothetical protein
MGHTDPLKFVHIRKTHYLRFLIVKGAKMIGATFRDLIRIKKMSLLIIAFELSL